MSTPERKKLKTQSRLAYDQEGHLTHSPPLLENPPTDPTSTKSLLEMTVEERMAKGHTFLFLKWVDRSKVFIFYFIRMSFFFKDLQTFLA